MHRDQVEVDRLLLDTEGEGTNRPPNGTETFFTPREIGLNTSLGTALGSSPMDWERTGLSSTGMGLYPPAAGYSTGNV